MPAVKQGETEEEYIARAVPIMMKSEGLSQKHALGKAYGMFKSAKQEHKFGVKNRRSWARTHKDGRGRRSSRGG